MKPFAFRLEKVLRWREARVDLEQFALDRLMAECARCDALVAQLEQARAQAERNVLASGRVAGRDLAALAEFQVHLRRQKLAALDRRQQFERKVEEQRARLLAARREFRLLEKLRQTRRAEWEMASNRELDALATENHLARWNR